jgi:hypothetical protein
MKVILNGTGTLVAYILADKNRHRYIIAATTIPEKAVLKNKVISERTDSRCLYLWQRLPTK